MSPIFQAGGALPADHTTYVERQADHDALRTVLDGDYLHIIAPRQIGKTSLLKRLAAKLDGMGWRCAYIDLSTLMDFSKSLWYAELGRTLEGSLTPGQPPSLANQIDLRRYLIDEALSWNASQPRIALFFDEVESASKAHDTDGKSFSDTFFMTLRNLYIQRDDYKGNIVIALAGAVNPSDLVKDPDISPFNVGQEIGLDDFSSTETRALTEHLSGLDVSIAENVYQSIYAWTSGHPYLTQRICAELETTSRKGDLTVITLDNVTGIVEQVIFNPTNPIRQDKNLRHVAKMLIGLSTPAKELWSRLQSGDSPTLNEIIDSAYFELYLTGTVKALADRIMIRNRIYETAFREKDHPDTKTAVNKIPWLVQVKGGIHVYLIDQKGNRHWIPDGPTLESIAGWEDVEFLVNLEELGKFPLAHPLPSVIRPLPWLVKVGGETEVYLIDKNGIRHRVTIREGLRSINPRTDVDLVVSWIELGQFPPGEPISADTLAGASKESTSSSPYSSKSIMEIRIKHLSDNIIQDLNLLNEYENALRFEDDPRRRARYRHEIEQLRESAERYSKEYESLHIQVKGDQPTTLQDIAVQLRQMDTKLTALLIGQEGIKDVLSDLRQTMLARFDASEHLIIGPILAQLDHNHLTIVQTVLDAVEGGRVTENELNTTVVALEQSLAEILERKNTDIESALLGTIERASEAITAPSLDIKHKLKIAIPIIPMILSYEGEVGLGSGINLEEAWQKLVGKIRGDSTPHQLS